jgi:hypothetical protein
MPLMAPLLSMGSDAAGVLCPAVRQAAHRLRPGVLEREPRSHLRPEADVRIILTSTALRSRVQSWWWCHSPRTSMPCLQVPSAGAPPQSRPAGRQWCVVFERLVRVGLPPPPPPLVIPLPVQALEYFSWLSRPGFPVQVPSPVRSGTPSGTSSCCLTQTGP